MRILLSILIIMSFGFATDEKKWAVTGLMGLSLNSYGENSTDEWEVYEEQVKDDRFQYKLGPIHGYYKSPFSHGWIGGGMQILSDVRESGAAEVQQYQFGVSHLFFMENLYEGVYFRSDVGYSYMQVQTWNWVIKRPDPLESETGYYWEAGGGYAYKVHPSLSLLAECNFIWATYQWENVTTLSIDIGVMY